jgi:hypothetical protein
MQGNWNYIPEKIHVSMVQNIAAILWLRFMAHVMLLLMINVLYSVVAAAEAAAAKLNRTAYPLLSMFSSW